jgi:cobalamin biosynthesis protein CobT
VPFDKKQIKEGSAYRFTEAEKKDSEMLIKLLDISFDPKSDDVKNLRIGKLDTSKIAEIPAGNMSVYKQTVEEQDTKPFSVCILADMSGSMGHGSRIQSQRHILNTLYLAMSQILPPDKLYIYGHSGDCSPEIYTFYSPYDPEYEKNIKFYNNVHWCQNYDGPVIEAIHKKVRETNDDRIIFISLSDGEPCGNGYGGQAHNEELKRILERARRDEFVTVGIGIEADHVGALYTYSKVVNDLRLLPKEVSSIVNQVVRVEFQ